MRAYLIDPSNKSVTEIEHDGSLHQLQKTVGGLIEAIPNPPPHHVIYVDEEGWIKAEENGFTGGFHFGTSPLFVGRGIVLGVDPDGESDEATIPIATIRMMVRFVE